MSCGRSRARTARLSADTAIEAVRLVTRKARASSARVRGPVQTGRSARASREQAVESAALDPQRVKSARQAPLWPGAVGQKLQVRKFARRRPVGRVAGIVAGHPTPTVQIAL